MFAESCYFAEKVRGRKRLRENTIIGPEKVGKILNFF